MCAYLSASATLLPMAKLSITFCMHCVAFRLHTDADLERSYQGKMQLSSAGHIVPAGADRPLPIPPHRGSAPEWEGLIGGQVTDDGAPLTT